MSIKKDDTNDYVSFYAYDSSDHITPKTGLSSFTVHYSLNNGAVTVMTTPPVAEKDATNMPGWYHLLVDEAGMVSAEGELNLDIKASGMDNVPLKIDIIGNTEKDVYDVVAHADYGNAKLVRSTTPANALDVSVTGEAGLDFANIKDATGAHTLTNITIPTVSALTGKTGFSLLATGADLILKDSIFALAIADAIWDEILTGATHNIANSAGRRVREIGAFAIHSGTAQAGTINSITIAATANGGDGIYNRNLIVLTGNTGKGQTRTIVDYNDTTKVIMIDRDWRVTPDDTTEYQIVPDDTPLTVDHGVAQGGTSTTITIRDYASSDDDIYLCNQIGIIAGTGRGQVRLVGAYNGTSKVVTICGDDWITIPDNTSVYVMMPYGTTCTSCTGDYAKSQIVAAIIAGIADGAYDLQEMMRLILAACVCKSSGGGTTTIKMRDAGDTKDRISATVDATGNRTAVTLDGS